MDDEKFPEMTARILSGGADDLFTVGQVKTAAKMALQALREAERELKEERRIEFYLDVIVKWHLDPPEAPVGWSPGVLKAIHFLSARGIHEAELPTGKRVTWDGV